MALNGVYIFIEVYKIVHFYKASTFLFDFRDHMIASTLTATYINTLQAVTVILKSATLPTVTLLAAAPPPGALVKAGGSIYD